MCSLMVKTTLERVSLGSESCGLVIHLVSLGSILCPYLVLINRGELASENYISQIPLLTGFLLDSANGKPWWELEAGRREKPGDFSPCFFAAGSGRIVPSLGPAPVTPFALRTLQHLTVANLLIISPSLPPLSSPSGSSTPHTAY